MPAITIESGVQSIHLPRILCLHGGGVNATIFKAQLRSFLRHPSLCSRFRFVFAEAPFLCDGAPAILPIYGNCAPFRRWLRWLPEHPEADDQECREMIVEACVRAMEKDEGVGEWVGIMGFSQGAKVAASLLYETQLARESAGKECLRMKVGGKEVEWRFAVVLAGRAPLVALSGVTENLVWCQRAGSLATDMDLNAVSYRLAESPEMKLRMPTLHVHGLKDEGLMLHRVLSEDYCASGTTALVEWDGVHRVPLKSGDVDRVVEAITHIANEYEM